MAQHNPNPPDAVIARGHEQGDASPRAVLIFVIVFIVCLVAVHAVARGYLDYLGKQENIVNNNYHPQHPLRQLMSSVPPDPRLEPEPSRDVLPRADLLAVQAREKSLLNTRAWLDPKHQFARIPLTEATDLAVDAGLPLTLPPIGSTTQQSTPLATAVHGPGGVP